MKDKKNFLASITFYCAIIDEIVINALQGIGHNITVVQETAAGGSFATPLGILVDHDNKRVHGGVDVFRIAEARGY